MTLIIEEYEELTRNQLFTVAKLYLATLTSPNLNRFKASLPLKEDKIIVSMSFNEETVDIFKGVEFKWRFSCKKIPITHVREDEDDSTYTSKSQSQFYQLIFNKKHKDFAVEVYLPYLLSKSKEIEDEKKTTKLYALRNDRNLYKKSWISIKLHHPSNFETLAMDYEAKKMIMDDLELFVKRKEYYKRVGKAWKRGYLLFGPPGTGKSSLIAAMATFLNFDIYDLQLTDLRDTTELRKLFISTGNRSILVVEDIDCSMELHNRKNQPVDQTVVQDRSQITLSGFLNFIDGLWSSCGDERIIIFTTNHKDRLDPALLRPGRMDMHIHMSYCTPSAFRQLAYKFLAFEEHPLFEEIEKLIQVLCVTPADVSERLMKIEDPEMALEKFFEFLQGENEVKEAKNAVETRARISGQKADEKIQT